ncbi:MAG: thioredoxin family protein [Firmicutes bacterium]|nr:thioredoxin family protein [Bacillota bacterium]
MLANMPQEVRLALFVAKLNCPYCDDTQRLLEEIADLSEKVKLEVHPRYEDEILEAALGIERVPALAILGADGTDYGIRYYGIPAGYEFGSLINDIVMVGRKESGLSDATRNALAGIGEEVHIQVFVTPTCPYCPSAVHLAHAMALESEHVHADMIEAQEFPDLAQRYNVYGVPKSVINETIRIEGAVAEEQFLEKVLEAVEKTG